mmetsp:Transcript_2138/g.4924  ORF Transcript_2138/g.4924 Transcript_2138/m.4924 type:complete len:278 (-) Transcript_2138:96-929(-)
MSVALSTVIFAPMSQFGWVVAFLRMNSGSSLHRRRSSSAERSRNAPPLAVRMMRLRPPGGTPWRDWKIAECSESAGVILTPNSLSSGRITGPPLMRVSLFASAMSFPALIASTVGRRPAQPTMPVTTTSASPYLATSAMPDSPNTNSGIFPLYPDIASFSSFSVSSFFTETILGLNFLICSERRPTLVPAAKPSIENVSGRYSTMSSVCVPIEPVDPSRLIFLWNLSPEIARSTMSWRSAPVPKGEAPPSATGEVGAIVMRGAIARLLREDPTLPAN